MSSGQEVGGVVVDGGGCPSLSSLGHARAGVQLSASATGWQWSTSPCRNREISPALSDLAFNPFSIQVCHISHAAEYGAARAFAAAARLCTDATVLVHASVALTFGRAEP